MSDLDVLDHITTTSLLGELTRDDLLSLDPLPEWVHLKGGETLIRQGDEGADYFLLVNGRLRVLIENNGRVVHSSFVHPGEGIGEMSLITGEPRAATVRAKVDSRLIRFSGETFRKLMMRRPDAALGIVRTIVHRLRAANLKTGLKTTISSIAILPLSSCPRHSADQLFASSESQTPQRRDGFETLVNRIITSPVVRFRSMANVAEPYARRNTGPCCCRSR
jgi:NTE family protein